MKRFAAAAAFAAVVLISVATSAAAKPGTHGGNTGGSHSVITTPINYGVADDGGKYSDTPATWFAALKGGGLTQARWTLAMNQSNPTVITDLPFLLRAGPAAQASGVRVIISLTAPTVKDGSGNVLMPSAISDPTAFCDWAALVVNTVKGWGIHDFIIGNEVNTAVFFAPQDANAPAKYEALLAKCYDTIHAADPSANVIGFGLSPRSNGPSQTAPLTFLKEAGAAYKASNRAGPIMDQLAIHPYPNPNSPTDSPDVGYPSSNPNNVANYGIPDLARVKQTVYDAFNNTGQHTTLNGLTFLIDELGWQTNTTAYGAPYFHDENVQVVSEQTQADFVKRSVQNYFACDPTVTDVEFFLLQDEASRDGKDLLGNTIGGGWQSGLMTAGGTPKLAYTQDAPLFSQGRAACTGPTINWTPAGLTTTTGGTTGNKLKGPCPRGASASDPRCAKLKAQVAQIRKSALQIEASYNSIVASCRKLLAKVKSHAVINQVNALLKKGAALDAAKKRLLTQAQGQSDVYAQRATVAKARQDIAIARTYAAQARVIAAIAVATGG